MLTSGGGNIIISEHQLHAAATVDGARLLQYLSAAERKSALSINLWYFERGRPASLFNLNPTGNTKKPSLLPLNH